MKCSNCNREGDVMIHNYVVRFESWEAYNCCCEDCARNCANEDGISDVEILFIDGGLGE